MEEKYKQKRKTHFSTLKRIIAVFMQYKVKMSLIIISIFITTGLNLLILLLLPGKKRRCS